MAILFGMVAPVAACFQIIIQKKMVAIYDYNPINLSLDVGSLLGLGGAVMFIKHA